MVYYCVDRIEDNIAVLVDEKGCELLLSVQEFEKYPKEGTMVYRKNPDAKFCVETKKATEKRAEMNTMLNALLEKKKK